MKKWRTILELFLSFLKISAFTFGGGYAMISLIDYEFVVKKRWLTEDEFMNLTVIAESTPGPIAINSATYTGYKQAGVLGSVAATIGMIVPSFVIIYLISMFFQDLLSIEVVASAFKGISVAVAIVIIRAAVKMIRKVLKKEKLSIAIPIVILTICFGITIASYFGGIHISTIWLILITGAAGYITYAIRSIVRKKGREKK